MAVVLYVPSRLGEDWWEDLPVPGAGDDGKAITYNHGTGAFVYAAASAPPPGSDTQVIINDGGAYGADPGLTYAKATDRLTVVGGLVAPSIRPASDSTTALQWQNAAGTALVTVDTTNGSVLFSSSLLVSTPLTTPGAAAAWITAKNTTNHALVVQAQSGATAAPLVVKSSTGANIFSVTTAGGITLLGSIGLAGGQFFSTSTAGTGNDMYRMVNVAAAGRSYYLGSINDGSFRVFDATASAYRIYCNSDGYWGIGQTSATALLDIAASTTARASSRQRAGTAPTAPEDGDMWNDGNAYAVRVNGTNAVNTDGGLSVWMQSSLQARNVGRLLWQYTDKTDVSRVTKGALTAYYQSTERKAIHWSADASGPTLSFGAVTTPIATPVLATGAGATADNIIQVLQNLGLVKQS